MFPSTFPFERMWKVVVGRWYVDSAILVYAHGHSFDVVDITSLASIHQGFDSSFNHMGKVPRKDFFWNAVHINSHLGNVQGRITSNYFIRCNVSFKCKFEECIGQWNKPQSYLDRKVELITCRFVKINTNNVDY